MNEFISAATEWGGATVASFGSGDTGGRARARAGRGERNASGNAVRALVNRVNRSDMTRAQRRRILDEIDMNTGRGGRMPADVLADLTDDVNELLS